MALVSLIKRYFCKKCDSVIKRIALADSHLEKWMCPKCGEVIEAYSKTRNK